MLGHGHADADRERDRVAADGERHGVHRVAQAFGRGIGAVHAGLRGHHQEFAAVGARHQVDFAGGVAQALGQLRQQAVAGVAAVAVVEVAQAVDVDVQQAELRAATLQALPFHRQQAVEAAAVGQPGQLVLVRAFAYPMQQSAADQGQERGIEQCRADDIGEGRSQAEILPGRAVQTDLRGQQAREQDGEQRRHRRQQYRHRPAVVGIERAPKGQAGARQDPGEGQVQHGMPPKSGFGYRAQGQLRHAGGEQHEQMFAVGRGGVQKAFQAAPQDHEGRQQQKAAGGFGHPGRGWDSACRAEQGQPDQRHECAPMPDGRPVGADQGGAQPPAGGVQEELYGHQRGQHRRVVGQWHHAAGLAVVNRKKRDTHHKSNA